MWITVVEAMKDVSDFLSTIISFSS